MDCKQHFIYVTGLLQHLKLENLIRQHHHIRINLCLDYEGKKRSHIPANVQNVVKLCFYFIFSVTNRSSYILKLTKSLFTCRSITYKKSEAEKHTLNCNSRCPE